MEKNARKGKGREDYGIRVSVNKQTKNANKSNAWLLSKGLEISYLPWTQHIMNPKLRCFCRWWQINVRKMDLEIIQTRNRYRTTIFSNFNFDSSIRNIEIVNSTNILQSFSFWPQKFDNKDINFGLYYIFVPLGRSRSSMSKFLKSFLTLRICLQSFRRVNFTMTCHYFAESMAVINKGGVNGAANLLEDWQYLCF